MSQPSDLTREILLAYPQGLFPMSTSAQDQSYSWYRPEYRGIMPLDEFHASRSLRRFAKSHANQLSVHLNRNFEATMRRCGQREDTWISEPIIAAFCELEALGLAYALEVDLDGVNIGGIYGLTLGDAFFGESMYSNATNGSKLALWALVTHLRAHDITLFDTQYLTTHLESLGGQEIHADQYQAKLNSALKNWITDNYVEEILRADWRSFDAIIHHNRRPIIGATIDPDIITRMIHSR